MRPFTGLLSQLQAEHLEHRIRGIGSEGEMPGDQAVKERIEQLIAQGEKVWTQIDVGRQRAWLTAASNLVQFVCPSKESPYHDHAQRILREPPVVDLFSGSISEMAALLVHLREEIKGGLLTTIENHAIAVTFDDFLDHGAEYLKHGRKDEAAVIAGIVFEDTIRRICRVLGFAENGVALETLISELAKRDPPVLTSLKAKRARAAAGLRTSAAHARWEEIQLGDVKPVIEFTRELMATHLG